MNISKPMPDVLPSGVSRLNPWQGYAFAVAATAATLGVRLALDPALQGQPTLVIFTLPILLSAYLGGAGAGLLATGLSCLAACYFLLPPIHSFMAVSAGGRWQLFFLALTGVVISGLNEVLHRARRRADAASQERWASEERYRTLFEYAPEGIVIADSASRYLDANASMCRMLGYTRDELVGLHASDIVAESESPQIDLAWNEIKARADHHRDWKFRRKDGSVFEAEVIATMMPDGHLLGVIRDITERRRAESAMARLAAIVEFSADAIVGKDLQSCVTSWNAGAERMFGYTASEMVGQPLTRLIPADCRDDEDQILAGVGRGENAAQFETRRLRKDGTLIDVSVTVSPIKNAEGQVIGASKVARDISARKRAEERAAWMVTFPERNPNPIVEFDWQTGDIHYMNPASARQFPSLQSQGLRHPLLAGLSNMDVLLEGKESVRRELLVSNRFLSQTITRSSIAHRLCVYSAEITELRNAELALREKETALSAADRRLAQIVHGMTEACLALDGEWRFTFVNDRGESLLRHRREEMLGRSIWEVFPALVGTPMELHYRRAMAERVPVNFEVLSPIVERWLDVQIFPTSEGLAAFLLDIHARKMGEEALRESEDLFSKAFRLSPDCVTIERRADHTLIQANEALCLLWGATPE